MGSDKKGTVESAIRDMYDQAKPEVEKFIKSVESMFDSSSEGKAAEKEQNKDAGPQAADQAPDSTNFRSGHFPWNPAQTYVIDASDRLVVTGTVVFDDRLSFTKSYNFTTGEVKIQDNRPLVSINSAREATSEERELLLPKPNLEEAVAILRSCISSPQERKAFDVIKSALNMQPAASRPNAQAADAQPTQSAPANAPQATPDAANPYANQNPNQGQDQNNPMQSPPNYGTPPNPPHSI